jgi:uncharacterized membrane protein
MVGSIIVSAVNHLGATICHQDHRRLLTVGSSSTWLCARCTGIYSAYFLVCIRDFVYGRKRLITLGGLAVCILLLGVCFFDAVFSNQSDGFQGLLFRYLSGVSAGIGLGLCINSVCFVTEPQFHAPISFEWRAAVAVMLFGLAMLCVGTVHVALVLDGAAFGGFIFLGVIFNTALLRVLGGSNLRWDGLVTARAAATLALFAAEVAAVRVFK